MGCEQSCQKSKKKTESTEESEEEQAPPVYQYCTRASAMMKAVQRYWSCGSHLKVNGEVPLVIYQSTRSKLRVVVADVPGPTVKGVLSFVTETNTDDGLPHTLEHLVFMGSQKYPFKGVLDVIANRCLASGTNAWTDQDHTAYTLSTVGSTGFLKVLPVYMNHVLSPTLTKEQFLTEVHHVNGQGEDAGVVYSEMQDHESDMDEIVARRRKQLFYPEGSPYRVETGGRLSNLRTSCNNEKVRAFHHQFYHLSNMLVVVCGIIDHDKLLTVVSHVEDELLSRIPTWFQTPFRCEMPSMVESVDAVIDCPSDDEQRGVVSISWAGPSATDLYSMKALEVLFDYMESTAVAPLEKDFIQLTDPFASAVCFSMSEQSTSEIVLNFLGVPTDKLQLIRKRVFEKTIAQHTDADKFDMERLKFVIDHTIQKAYNKMETSAHDKVFELMIVHQLYGTDEKQLEQRLDEVGLLQRLTKEPASYWSDLVSKYLDEHYICVMGKPSTDKVEQYSADEEERVEKQRDTLGEEGLMDSEQNLLNAIEKNTAMKPTAEVLKDLIVNDLEKFNTFEVATKCNVKRHHSGIAFIDNLPFTAFLHRSPTKFVELSMVWDTSKLSVEKRMWLMLWFELIFESPAKVGDSVLPYEEVSKLFTRDLIKQSIEVGIHCYYNRFVTFKLKVAADKYPMLEKWSRIFLDGVMFEGSRVEVSAQKLASQAVEAKRDGSSVCATLLTRTLYQPESNSCIYGTIQLEKFHEEVARKATNEPQWVEKQLEQLRSDVLSLPVNMHLACDDSLLPKESRADSWSFLDSAAGDHKRDIFTGDAGGALRPDGFGVQKVTCVGGAESSFLYQSCLFDQTWQGEDLMATMLLSQYLTQCEGPLWRGVRGEGLAYGANIYVQPDNKLLTLMLYRCAQINRAYDQTKKVVLGVLNDENGIDEDEFEAAKRSLVCELMEAQDTVKRAVNQTILSEFRQLPSDFTRELCIRIWNASSESVLKAGAVHIRNLFEDIKCTRAIVVHPSKLKDVQSHFPEIQSVPLEDLAVPFEC